MYENTSIIFPHTFCFRSAWMDIHRHQFRDTHTNTGDATDSPTRISA